ncbi:MAG: choice-of-anchor J domain-containing protein [Bacteroidaceae bacterium]|nr:choice-of-anchor J domain-containing protein [Bacteroidaceae bacterium]
MKKTFKTFALMLLTAFAFSSCVDVPAPFNLPDKGGNSSGGGSSVVEGTPVTCAEAADLVNALADGATSSELYTITGYITQVVGEVSKNQQTFWMADTKDGGKVFEAYWANLPEGVTAFTVGMKVKITGKLMKYVNANNGNVIPEMKNATVQILEDDGGGTSGESTLIDFTKGMGSWTPNNVSGPDVWTNDSKYGAVASGFDNDNQACQAAEGWLISPEIDLTNSTNTQIVLNEAINKIGTGSVDAQCQVLACINDGQVTIFSDWQLLVADKRPAGTSWTYQDDSFNASAFDGKKIMIAFRYVSTESSAPQWEIKTVKLKNGDGGEGGGSGTTDSSKENPLTVAQAKNASGNNYVKGYIVGYIDGMSYSGATFSVPSAAETEILLADSPNETNPDNAFPVQLPAGDIRNALELSAHPAYLQQEVLLYGSVEKYFGVTGMKSTSWAQINGQSYGVDPEGGSGGDDTPVGDIISVTCDEAVQLTMALADGGTSTETYAVTGYITETDGKVSRNQQTFWMADDVQGGQVFEAYWANLTEGVSAFTVGMKVKLTGKLMKYIDTKNNNAVICEIKNGNVEILEQGDGGQGGDGGDTPGPGGDEVTDLVNGNFEEWVSESEPVGWKSASSASNATLEQHQFAHNGEYSCLVKCDAANNKRLATQEITLAPGKYVFSYYAMAAGVVAQTKCGYVPMKADGTVGSYKYGSFVDLNNNGWSLVSYEFTLTEQTTLCLVIMNPKSNANAGYTAADILVDDATLVKQE